VLVVGVGFEDADEIFETCALTLFAPVRAVIEEDVEVDAAQVAQ
jgi:hypothetical protein